MADWRDRSDEDTDEHPIVGFGQAGQPAQWQPPQPAQWQPPQPPQWQPPQPPQWPQATPERASQQQPPHDWQGAAPGPSGQWSQQQPYWHVPRYGSSGLAISGAIALIVLGVLLAIIFAFALLVFDAIAGFDAALQLNRAEADAVKVIIGAVLVVALVQVIAGIGVLAHREWARIIGIVTAVLGTLVGALGVIGVIAEPDPPALVFALALLGGYALALFGLIAGAVQFRRYY